ncbi:hypothetical protein T484DRAFT_2493884 [Baffinella frigidus]|nr:hypothetical protein T484DRAFT_2493884 [Cryptophyta sp. CCMP2293]
MVTIYETKVKEFGNTATIVTVIIAVINALLNIILIVMTLNTVRVITLVKAEVVACRLALALPRSTGKKIHAYYKEEHLKLSALGDEQADKDGIMAEEDPDTQRRGSIHGSVQGLQDLMAFKFGRPPSIASIDNEASAKLRITDPIKTPSPPDDVAGMEPNGDTAVASNPETWEKSFDQRFSISKHLLNERLVMGPTMTLNFGTPPNGGRLKSAMKHTTSVGSGSTASRHGAATPPSPVPWSDRRGSDPTNQTPAAAVWDQGPSDPSSQGAAAKQSTQLVTSVNLSEHPLLLWDDDRELERFSLQDDKDVSERSELNHSDIDRSDEQRSDSDRSDEPSDKDSSDEDHSTSDESEHEQHSLLVGEGERVSVGGSNFGASGGGVVRQDVSPAARPAAGLPESEGNAQESEGEGGYKRPPMNTQGSFKNSPWGKVGQLVRRQRLAQSDRLRVGSLNRFSGRRHARAEDSSRGSPTQSHISPSIPRIPRKMRLGSATDAASEKASVKWARRRELDRNR